MLSHSRIWEAIDRLAAQNSLTPSGLARRAGLDPTTFNRSKRLAADGRPRWPSTESIAKILEATRSQAEDFFALLGEARSPVRRAVPLLGLAQAGSGGFFDDAGFPAGEGWEEVHFPAAGTDPVYALEVAGDSMQPLYRDGDVIIVSPTAPVRRGDRVVVRTRGGEVMAKVLERRTTRSVELLSLNPAHENRTFKLTDLDWMARIIWASQ